MFLSAILKAHSDGPDSADVSNLADVSDLIAANEESKPATAARTKADLRADALAAREARLIELPAIHRARWL